MSEKEKARSEVLQIVADIAELPIGEISLTATLDELDIDSLNALRILAEVEKRYGIHIPDDDVIKIRTMPQILALVDAHEFQE